MKKIKVFLASSIEDLKLDRIELGDYFNQLNEVYIDQNVHFSLIKCEAYDNGIALEGKQSQYDEEIRNCDLCLFLFFTKVGQYTLNEFEVAMEAYKQNGRPSIVTYFKDPDRTDSCEVKTFMARLNDEMHHYYNKYDHIDTLKLGILMQIKRLGFDISLAFTDGSISSNGIELIRTENVPVFKGNASYSTLNGQRLSLINEINTARKQFLSSPTDENEAKYNCLKAQMASVSEELEKLENAMLDFLSSICDITSDGKVLTHRQKEALNYYNSGDYASAKALLEDESREVELNRAQSLMEKGKNEVIGYVNEDILWIKAQSAQGIDSDSAEKINSKYEKIIELSEKYGLDRRPLLSYIHFLINENRPEKAKQLILKSEGILKTDKPSYIKLLTLKSKLYIMLHQYRIAEQACLEALELLDGSEAEERLICYNYLGLIYQYLSELDTAEKYLLMAIEEEKNVSDGLAGASVNLALVYEKSKKYELSEKYFLKAEKIYSAIKNRSVSQDVNYGITLMNLADIYKNTLRYEDAEKLFLSACEILKKASAFNPRAFEYHYAPTLSNYGNLLRVMNRYDEAYAILSQAAELLRLSRGSAEEIYDEYYCSALSNLAIVCGIQKKYDEALLHLEKAKEVREELYKKSPDAFNLSLGNIYSSIGNILLATNDFKEAEKNFYTALKYYEKSKKSDPAGYCEQALTVFNSLGLLYRDNKLLRLAEKVFLRAIKEAKDYENVFVRKLAVIKHNLANLYKGSGKYKKAEKYFNEALSLKEQIFLTDKGFAAELVILYADIGSTYTALSKHSLAEEYFLKAEKHLHLCNAQTGIIILMALADVLMEQGKHSEAESFLKRITQSRGEGEDILQFKSMAYYKLGIVCDCTDRPDEAEEYFKLSEQ